MTCFVRVALCYVICCIFSFADANSLVRNNDLISLDLQHVNIQDALHLLAKRGKWNLIISPQISGVVTLHLDNRPVEQVLNLILHAYGLVKWEDHHVWYIMTRSEWIQQKQEEQKLQHIVLDAAPLITRIWQMHYMKAEELVHFIRDSSGTLLSKHGDVHVDARTNQVCIRDTDSHLIQINRLIKRLDVPVQQVLIEARLASVDHDFERDLGIHFSIAGRGSSSAEEEGALHYGLGVAKLVDGSLLDVKLAALESQGRGELISSPSLFAASQQSASIEAGEEIPYQEVSRSGATGVTFKKAVLSLKVMPQILPGNKVLLQLQVNQDKPSRRMVLGVPAITTRQVTTSVLVNDGQTLVLGGIFESNRDKLSQGIPYLSKIPLVGWLFQQQNVSQNKRELLIFVTPKIMTMSSTE